MDVKLKEMQKPRVVNVRDFPFEYPTPYIYVGRYMPGRFAGHPLANPFKVKRSASVAERVACLDRYREWLRNLPDRDVKLAILARKVVLSGLPLGCWCAPRECHADVLAEELLEPMRNAACELEYERIAAEHGG